MADFKTITSISMSIYTDTVTSPTVTLTYQSDTVTDYTSSVTVQDVIYSSTVQYIPDYYSQTNSQAYSLFENTSITITPDLTCSYSYLTSITYSIANYLTQARISINSKSGQLSITAPSVTADTNFSFYINSVVSGTTIQKLISVTVLNWVVEFCSTCSSSSTCSAWNSGYNLTSSGTCSQQIEASKISETAKALLTSTQVMTGLSLLVIVILSLVNSSTICNFWSVINQIQILNLLLLSRAYLPEDVTTIIKGLNLLANPTSLIPIQNNYLYKLMSEIFDSNWSNPHFQEFGLNANSSVLKHWLIFNNLNFYDNFACFRNIFKEICGQMMLV